MTLDELLLDIKLEYPEFALVEKRDSALMKAIDALLVVITFWQLRTFMTRFTTTLGYIVYTPTAWEDLPDRSKMAILQHERVHMHQKKLDGFWFSAKYLLLPFPILWAYYRMKYEMEAYEESMKELWKAAGARAFDEAYKQGMLQHFTSAEYFWAWPWKKRLNAWYDGVIKRMQG
jgi:hypothetical protein